MLRGVQLKSSFFSAFRGLALGLLLCAQACEDQPYYADEPPRPPEAPSAREPGMGGSVSALVAEGTKAASAKIAAGVRPPPSPGTPSGTDGRAAPREMSPAALRALELIEGQAAAKEKGTKVGKALDDFAAHDGRLVIVNGKRLMRAELEEIDRLHCGKRVADGSYWLNPGSKTWGVSGESGMRPLPDCSAPSRAAEAPRQKGIPTDFAPCDHHTDTATKSACLEAYAKLR